LGPLVYGACWCPADKKDDLKKLGFDGKPKLKERSNQNFGKQSLQIDSKVLKEEVRDKFFKAISTGDTNGVELGWRVHVSQPEELSNKMLRL
jgi:ribonuclease HII